MPTTLTICPPALGPHLRKDRPRHAGIAQELEARSGDPFLLGRGRAPRADHDAGALGRHRAANTLLPPATRTVLPSSPSSMAIRSPAPSGYSWGRITLDHLLPGGRCEPLGPYPTLFVVAEVDRKSF